MDRADLERLDRDTLIEKATEAGVPRARILTRPELIDELLIRQTANDARAARKARGFFGLARDLIASVVERGLHLPDAAERIRGLPTPPLRTAPAALPTVTLAEIYAAQGHRERAIETLRKVLEREPDHGAARAMLATLEDAKYKGPEPALPPEEEEAASGAAAAKTATAASTATPVTANATAGTAANATASATREEAAEVYAAVDECIAIPDDETSLFVYWGLRKETLLRFGDARDLVLRTFVVEPSWEGPRSSSRDELVRGAMGHTVVRDLPRGAICRVAIGCSKNGTFVPAAHSPALDRSGASLVRWTLEGRRPVRDDDDDAPSIARARERMAAV